MALGDFWPLTSCVILSQVTLPLCASVCFSVKTAGGGLVGIELMEVKLFG